MSIKGGNTVVALVYYIVAGTIITAAMAAVDWFANMFIW